MEGDKGSWKGEGRNGCLCRCEDKEKVKVVQVVARRIDKLSTRLVECADHVAEAMTREDGQPDQTVQEDTEILRRDWSSQASAAAALAICKPNELAQQLFRIASGYDDFW